MKNCKIKIFTSIFGFALLLLGKTAFSQDDTMAVAKADTSHFRPNKEAGWTLYNSYVNRNSDDSVSFELIIQHERETINWNEEQYIGNIKGSSLFPTAEQKIIYYLINDSYTIKIAVDGTCYLSLLNGSLPQGDPVIIPIQIKYY